MEDDTASAVATVMFDVFSPCLAPDRDGDVGGWLREPDEDERRHVALLIEVWEEVGWETRLGIDLYRAHQFLVTVILRTRDKTGSFNVDTINIRC